MNKLAKGYKIVDAGKRIEDVINLLEKYKILFIIENGKFYGTVTYGDLRRALGQNFNLTNPVSRIANKNSKFVLEYHDSAYRKKIIDDLPDEFRYLPILNERNEIVDILTEDGLFSLPNHAVIMAGGLGKRLQPLTNDIPKPMLHIGNKPILQTIIEQFRVAGIKHIHISVNYKADVIIDYFGDGNNFGVQIKYLHEEKPMGTAGCLSLLEKRLAAPFFVMNADILTDLDFANLIDYHTKNNYFSTMCVYEHVVQIPFGVIKADDCLIYDIKEKPSEKYLINAGIYLLDPDVINFIPQDDFYNMTSLFQLLIAEKKRVGIFHLKDYWTDIGNFDDFNRANKELLNQKPV